MSTKQALSAVAVAVGIAVCAAPSAAAAKGHPHAPVVEELASFAAPGCTGGCGSGSTIGPDGALYVTDGKAGRVLRVDPRSGAVTTFATGLPRSTPPGIGGAIDIAFVGHTAYVLATLAGPGSVSGIYRIGRNGTGSPIADIGRWSVEHPPATPFSVASGVQYALEPYQGGLRGHRRAPQSRPARGPRRQHQRDRRVRQRRPDGPRGAGPRALHRPGRPGPPSAG